MLSLVNSDVAHSKLSEGILREMVRDIASAVGWMHGVGVVHRDLKLESNDILLSD